MSKRRDVKDKVYYVYEWYNTDTNEVFYVGKGKDYRYKNHKKRNKFFLDYYNTHNCNVRKIAENLSEKEAFEKEKETILYYKNNTNYRLTNQTDGGEGSSGLIVTEEFREKMRKINTGEKNPNYNNKWSKEQRELLSNKMIGRYKGENNPNYNNKWSKEQRKNFIRCKKVYCDNKIFDSLRLCAEEYNIKYTTMQSWVNGYNNTPKRFKEMGLRWYE